MRGSASRPSPPGAAAGTSPPAGPRTTRWSGSSTGRTATSLSTTPAATPTCCARCCRGRRRPRRGPETSAPSCHRIEDEAAGNVLFALLKRAHLLHRERAAFMEARGVPGGDLQLGSEVEERQLSRQGLVLRSEEHTSELQSLTRSSYAVCCLTNKKDKITQMTPE